ncbi:MAG: DUF445 family protein [Lachnospiraceae bacterium]|nr:DUF445 family protein [Lachnospiraceae bacterium]
MEWIKYISGPLIGGIIGYFTNMIAVKMLFYPKHEVKVFGRVLPFTPGAIPKGKERLATAIGNAVADSLLTREDVEKILMSPETENEIAGTIMKHCGVRIREEICELSGKSPEIYDNKKVAISKIIAEEIIRSIDVSQLMKEYGNEYIREKINKKKLGWLISDDRIDSLTTSISKDLQEALSENGTDYISSIVKGKIDSLDDKTVVELLENAGIKENTIRNTILGSYRSVISNNMDTLLSHLNIAGIVSDKINAMDVDELEKMILSVMKKELNSIISLGALIGVVIGLLNLLL